MSSLLAGTTRVHSITPSGTGSPLATLCGNFQLLPLAAPPAWDDALEEAVLEEAALEDEAASVAGALSAPPPQAARLPSAAETVRKPLLRRKSRLSIVLPSLF
jgi:hypothetical protein